MSLNLIESWYSQLPGYEREMPIIRLDNVSYTPKQVLNEVRKGTSIGEKLQVSLEAIRAASSPQDEVLAEQRILKLLEERPIRIAMLVDPKYGKEEFTSKELIEHIKEKDKIGKALVKAESKQLEAMIKLGK